MRLAHEEERIFVASVVILGKFKSRIRGETAASPTVHTEVDSARVVREFTGRESLMGKCDVMRVTEWLIE